MYADLDRTSELSLSQANEASQRRDIFSGFEAPLHQPLSEAGRDRSLEQFICQFGDIGHSYRSMCER
jgi:hypothetical protein